MLSSRLQSGANRAILPKNLFNAQCHNGVIPLTLGQVFVFCNTKL